jgi:hypothetical protein
MATAHKSEPRVTPIQTRVHWCCIDVVFSWIDVAVLGFQSVFQKVIVMMDIVHAVARGSDHRAAKP